MNSAPEFAVLAGLATSTIGSRGLSSFLQDQASIRPEHSALAFENTQITYRELLDSAKSFATQLVNAGVKHGDRVGLLFANQPNYVAAFFAILGLGAIVVPINPLLKSEEIAHILSDSDSKALVVYERGLSEVLKALPELKSLREILVVSSGDALEALPGDFPNVRITQLNGDKVAALGRLINNFKWSTNIDATKDLAVLVYTSGTTGKPKGAMLSHNNLLSTVHMAHFFIEITSDDKFLAVIPLCHIYGLAVIMLGVLAKGGTVVILEKFDPRVALDLMKTEGVTGLPAVPAMYQFMLMEMEKNPIELPSLRVCMSGAAAMPLELFERLRKCFGVPVIEGYGLTETSSVVSINPLKGQIKVGSVGLPLPPVEVSIFAKSGERLGPGPGNIGEVAVKGPNVMCGYFGKPEASQDCMRAEWFLTGDLGYVDEDGYLYIAGRSKELIIRGGQNIYPKEIEDVIMRIPGVVEVAVVGVPDKFMGERVKAVVVLKKDEHVSEDDVRQFCAELLADYKVPRLVEFVAALPRNSTGKILKRVLQTT